MTFGWAWGALVAAMGVELALTRRRPVYAGADTLANVVSYGGYVGVLAAFWTAQTYFFYDRVYEHACFDLGPEGPLAQVSPVLPWALLVVLEDLCFYVFHRTSHRVRLLWTAHQVHHSSRCFNFSVALRQSWAPFLSTPFWLVLPWLGFPPEAVLTVQAASLLFQAFQHTQLVRSYGPLDLLFNSPAHHRGHHGREGCFVDKNFGGVFILWDRLFGTFQAGRPVAYGMDQAPSANPLGVQWGPWAALVRDLGHAGSVRSMLRQLWSAPGSAVAGGEP